VGSPHLVRNTHQISPCSAIEVDRFAVITDGNTLRQMGMPIHDDLKSSFGTTLCGLQVGRVFLGDIKGIAMYVHHPAEGLEQVMSSQLALLLVSKREGASEQVAGEAYLRRAPSRLNVPRQAVKIRFSGRRCSDELGVNWLLVLVVVDRVL